MGKLFGWIAAALLMGAQAQAAVITGPSPVVAGQSYTYTYDTGPVDLLPGYDFYILNLIVSDGVNEDYFGRFASADPLVSNSPFPFSNPFTFDWVFSVTGPALLSVTGYLESYADATITYGVDGFPSIFKTEGVTRVGLINLGTDGLQISVVPIGGTLPLLLTAIGLVGWVARRRAAAGAVPA